MRVLYMTRRSIVLGLKMPLHAFRWARLAFVVVMPVLYRKEKIQSVKTFPLAHQINSFHARAWLFVRLMSPVQTLVF